MKQKQIIMMVVIIIAIIVLGGGGYVLYSKTAGGPNPTPTPVDEVVVPTISPDEIGFTLSAITSGKYADHGVDMKITKISDVASIDYELAYTSKGGIPRGAIGHVDVKPGQSSIDQQLYFGTCSDVCHPDVEVSGVKVTLKITKTDGKSYQATLPFNQ